jgi:DNA-binding beta-propeller fold protein YncE
VSLSVVFLLSTLVLDSSVADAAPFLYATSGFDSGVSQFGASGGLLAPLSPAVTSTPPLSNAVAVSPDGASVYADSESADEPALYQYAVEANGTLSALAPPTAPLQSLSPGAIAVRPDGASVYALGPDSSNEGTVWQYSVGSCGGLAPKTPATVGVGTVSEPSGIATSADGDSVYVTDNFENKIYQYDVGADGKLSPKSPASVSTDEDPGAIATTPNGSFVYVANLIGHTVTQYDVGTGGKLTQSSSLGVPDPAAIAISPDSGSAYISVDVPFAERVEQYDIGSDGSLTAKTPTVVASGFDAGPIVVSPDGSSAYVTNFGDLSISQFTVGSGGKLTPEVPPKVDVPNGIAGLAIGSPTAAGQYQLCASTFGAGSGSITGPSISCPGTCTHTFASGTPVTLTATPATGATFAGWQGACSGTGSCQVTMDSIKSIGATFDVPVSATSPPVASTGVPKSTVTSKRCKRRHRHHASARTAKKKCKRRHRR